MKAIESTVYTNADNEIHLRLTEDEVALVDHTIIIRAILSIHGGAVLDSQTQWDYFDLTQADRLILKLGNAGLPVGVMWAELKVYTATLTNGVVWAPLLKLTVQ